MDMFLFALRVVCSTLHEKQGFNQGSATFGEHHPPGPGAAHYLALALRQQLPVAGQLRSGQIDGSLWFIWERHGGSL